MEQFLSLRQNFRFRVIDNDSLFFQNFIYCNSIKKFLAGLIVVIRRELDQEAAQNQEMALDLLHSLIGPLVDDFIPVSFPSGQYEKFDQSEAESLGEGLIDLSGKELISALVEMNIFARLRFLLANPQTPDSMKIQILQILSTFAGHSLTVATKLFESNFLIETLIKMLPGPEKPESNDSILEENSFRILDTLARNGNHLARKIFESKGVEASIVYGLLGTKNSNIQSVSSVFFSTLLKLGVGESLCFQMMPKFAENFKNFGEIICAYFEISENSSENLQRIRSVVKTCPKENPFFLSLVTLLARKALILTKEAAFIGNGSKF